MAARPMPARFALGSVLSALATVVLVVRHGFDLPAGADAWLDGAALAIAAGLAGALAAAGIAARARDTRFAGRRIDLMLALLLALALGAQVLHWVTVDAMTLVRTYLVANVLLHLLRAQERVLSLRIQPVALLAGAFATLIVAGTLLLALPRASADPAAPLGWLDAAFMATSAVSVTGLVVRDVGREFSMFGQGILLGLIQLGGLGIITFVATLGVLTGRALSVPQLVVLREITSSQGLADVRRQILAIALGAAAIELAGAAVLHTLWPEPTNPETGRFFQSVFHAISAFCNAGFTLTPDSLSSVAHRPAVVLTMTSLIIVGGLGFPVLRDLRRPGRHGRGMARLRVHTRLALVTTVILLVGGGAAYALLEAHALGAQPFGVRSTLAFFEAATARTAGFTTTDVGALQTPTSVLLMILMAIGAGPVSTGGGIKTVTFAVLLLTVRAMIGGRDRVEVYGRTLPRQLVYAALSVFVLYVLAAITVTMALAVADPHLPLHQLSFEAVSALSTVGLSTGITGTLSTSGKLILCCAMFIGRIGPLALVMSVFGARRAGARYDYPEEEVVVG